MILDFLDVLCKLAVDNMVRQGNKPITQWIRRLFHLEHWIVGCKFVGLLHMHIYIYIYMHLHLYVKEERHVGFGLEI